MNQIQIKLDIKLGGIILYKTFWGGRKTAIYNGKIGDFAFIDDYYWWDNNFIVKNCTRIPINRIIATFDK